MKTKQLLALAPALLVLGACSTDSLTGDIRPSAPKAGDPGYLNLSIRQPQQGASRAGGMNDNFDDGEATEYGVTKLALLLFKGESEEAATFVEGHQIDIAPGQGTPDADGDQVSQTYSVLQKITTPDLAANDKLYALVVANAPDNLLKLEGSTWKLLNEDITTSSSLSTFHNGQLQLAATPPSGQTASPTFTIAQLSTDNNFLMLNAPLYTVQGGVQEPRGGSVVTLSQIDNIYKSQNEAAAGIKTPIYLERAVAKVSVLDDRKPAASGEEEGEEEITTTPLQFDILGWTLDLTNMSSFVLRNSKSSDGDAWWNYASTKTGVLESEKYRFVGAMPVAAGLYRTYWATDPNYDGTDYVIAATNQQSAARRAGESSSQNGSSSIKAGTFAAALMPYAEATWHKVGNSQSASGAFGANVGGADASAAASPAIASLANKAYCLENTFNVENMNQDQTTRVIVAAKVTIPTTDEDDENAQQDADGTFYTLFDNRTTYYNTDGLKKYIWNKYFESEAVKTALQTEACSLQPDKSFTIDCIKNFTLGKVSETTDWGGQDGYVKVTGIEWADAAADAFVSAESAKAALSSADIIAAINNAVQRIAQYKGGICYYPVRIQHFGDASTPWEQPTDGNGSYGTGDEAAKNYLGRYGVLRNNWYEISVNAIRNLGDPGLPPAYSDPDDPSEKWISVEINVLSWAKRSQGVDL